MSEPAQPQQQSRSSEDVVWAVALWLLVLAALVNVVNWALVKFEVKPGPAEDLVPIPLLMVITVLIVVRRQRRATPAS